MAIQYQQTVLLFHILSTLWENKRGSPTKHSTGCFKTVIPGAVMYYSVTEAGVARYRAGDVQDGFDSIAHGSRDDTDMDTHEVRVDVQLEESETYLLWVAYGTPDDLELEKTNIVHVPKPCADTPNVLDATAECESPETCVVTCDPGFDGGSTEYFCEIDGTWSSSEDLICTPASGCPETIDVPNAESQCLDVSLGSSCQVGCIGPDFEGQSTFTCGDDNMWIGELNCQPTDLPDWYDPPVTPEVPPSPGGYPNTPNTPYLPMEPIDPYSPNPPGYYPGAMCADSVPGIEHGTSMCMDTSDGAQCTVTCVDGTQGDAIFTCQQGVWMGQLTCSSPPAAQQFALFASGQFCEPEDFEHIFFGPVTSASECAYKVSQNPYCTDKFYTGCCGSAVCACVRVGMRCSLEEADEEYLGTNVYQLINSDHPNNGKGKKDSGSGNGMGGWNNNGQGGSNNGWNGWNGGGAEVETPKQGGGNQGGFGNNPGNYWGGFDPFYPLWPNNPTDNYGGNSGSGPDNGWNPNGDEIETTTTTTTTTSTTTSQEPMPEEPDFPVEETCFDLIDDCKVIVSSNMCDIVTECPRSCGTCTAGNTAFTAYRSNAYCRSQVQGQYVLKELPHANSAQECANAVSEDTECSSVFTASETFCACVQRGASCEPDSSAHGNTIFYISQRLGTSLQSSNPSEPNLFADEVPFRALKKTHSSIPNSSKRKQAFPFLFFTLVVIGGVLFGTFFFWRSRVKANLRAENLSYYHMTTDA